jgi:TPR repeat protein
MLKLVNLYFQKQVLSDNDLRKVDLLKKSVVDGLKRVLFAVLIITANSARAELSQHELKVFDNEPPVIAELLKRAVFAERDVQNAEGEWQAAKLYCEASRHGSAEAQFRLGMLYATGKGVPADRDLAASLFVVASSHGHFEAQKMLETLELVAGD